jgi:hypothetical protein
MPLGACRRKTSLETALLAIRRQLFPIREKPWEDCQPKLAACL